MGREVIPLFGPLIGGGGKTLGALSQGTGSGQWGDIVFVGVQGGIDGAEGYTPSLPAGFTMVDFYRDDAEDVRGGGNMGEEFSYSSAGAAIGAAIQTGPLAGSHYGRHPEGKILRFQPIAAGSARDITGYNEIVGLFYAYCGRSSISTSATVNGSGGSLLWNRSNSYSAGGRATTSYRSVLRFWPGNYLADFDTLSIAGNGGNFYVIDEAP